MNASDLLVRLGRVRASGAGKWIARCPAHEDRSPSLSIAEGREGILLRCWAGCETQAVLDALGLDFRHLFAEKSSRFAQRTYRPRSARVKPKAIRGARWFEVAPHDDDPLWRTFIARAIEERAWLCEVRPDAMRDSAESSPALALAIIDEAATALRAYARSEAGK